MSGCIYADTPEWGTGDGQIKVTIDSSSNTADIQSKMEKDTVTTMFHLLSAKIQQSKLQG